VSRVKGREGREMRNGRVGESSAGRFLDDSLKRGAGETGRVTSAPSRPAKGGKRIRRKKDEKEGSRVQHS